MGKKSGGKRALGLDAVRVSHSTPGTEGQCSTFNQHPTLETGDPRYPRLERTPSFPPPARTRCIPLASKNQQSTGSLAAKPGKSMFSPVAITYVSKRKKFETLSSASVRVTSFPLGSRPILTPISASFQTARISFPRGKQPYISTQCPLVFAGEKGEIYLSSSTAWIDDSVRSKRGGFFHYHLLSQWDTLPLRCILRWRVRDTADQRNIN